VRGGTRSFSYKSKTIAGDTLAQSTIRVRGNIKALTSIWRDAAATSFACFSTRKWARWCRSRGSGRSYAWRQSNGRKREFKTLSGSLTAKV